MYDTVDSSRVSLAGERLLMSSFLKNRAEEENFRLARELEREELFFELNLDEDAILRSQDLFGQIARSDLRTLGHTGFIKRYPALTLVALLGHAGVAYDHGTFWETFWDATALDPDPDFAIALRHQLYYLLYKFRMRTFPELLTESKYVMAMALHAGIPVNCLGDLVDVIEDHIRKGRDPSGVAVLEWLAEPGMEYRLNRLDVPVRNFLQLGGRIAVDILDRVVEFLIFTLENPEPWNDLTLDTSTTGLPTLVLDGLIARLKVQPFGADVDRGAARLRHRPRPVVSYSMEDDQVMVGVPYPSQRGDLPWKVTVAGATREVYAERPWGLAQGEEVPPTPMAVTAPAREVLMRHEASGDHHRVAVVDTADPMLLFTPGGRLVKSRASLPRGEVLALVPKDGTVVDALTGEELGTEGDRSPMGWHGWKARLVDLSSHDSIQLRRGNTPTGSIRGVRSVGSPRIDLGDPVVGLRSAEGIRVYAQRPEVTLPAHIGTEPLTWRVRVRESGQSLWLADSEWESDTVESVLDPFDGIAPGLLGLYEIWINGPVGSDLRYSVFLAEGVEVEYGDSFRTPVSGGLSEAIAAVTCTEPLTTDCEWIEFGVDDRDSAIRIDAGGHGYRMILTPPYFEARVDTLGTPAEWRTSAKVLAPADLEGHAVVAARVPGNVSVSIALLDDSGAIVQEEYPEVPADNVFQVPTRAFVDTARRVGACRLVALIDEEAKIHTVTIAHIRPARLCESVELRERTLVFSGLAEEEDLAVWVWAVTAPWRPVARLSIADKRAVLPDDLHESGDLIVQVFVDDPWVTVTRPSTPDLAAAMRVAQHGWVVGDHPAVDDLAQFLAGEASVPLAPAAVPGAWEALAMLGFAATDAESRRVREGLLKILARHPRAALEALGNSTISPAKKMALLIRIRLIDRPYSASDTRNDLHPDPWVGCMVEISDLPSLYARRRAVVTERSETLGYLTAQGGAALLTLLQEGRLTNPTAGIVDAVAVSMDERSEEEIDRVYEAVQLVPGALLDVDSRVSAVANAFRLRSAWSRDPACEELARHASRALMDVKSAAPALFDLIAARDEVLHGIDVGERPWALLSVQSLIFAAVVRLDARGEFEKSPVTPAARAAWATFAEYFPDLVATDILIADAAVTYLVHGDLIGEPA
ncbi:hypothetical protein [Gordonia sihwensis]|uniref:hypothetical protein n=1 Tax=Gordonia sihwensis TaxID=173559 RepID=UPI002415BF66|nr:hypothetical protein [Gordonia sihwensis]WFN91655.1 hypothetical protein P5P27_12775 [Gordonia sihwensis]